MNKKKSTGKVIATTILFFAAIGIIGSLFFDTSDTKELSYSELLSIVEAGQVETITMQPYQETIDVTGTFADGTEFHSTILNNESQASAIESAVSSSSVEVIPPPTLGFFGTLIASLLPIMLIIGFFYLMTKNVTGQNSKAMDFGKSRARRDINSSVKFVDVAGYEEEKEELKEVVDFLKNPIMFNQMGARIPKGVLLVGPPGTGKTLLARSVAGEANVPFFSISGSDFVEMFVGVGASRVRDMFKEAKKQAPCIIFIDEIDAVGRERGAGLGGGNDERGQTLNQLLVEMDGFGVNRGIILLAATNRPDVLDKALLRPGRSDRQVTIDLPDLQAREMILQLHASKKKLTSDIKIEEIARKTPGFSGADLENVLNEAAIIAVRENKKEIDQRNISEAIDRVIAGPAKKNKKVSEKERQIVSYHEAGHVIIGLELDSADFVEKVTIVPRGRAGGYAVSIPREDRSFHTRRELLDKITGLLGGRVAEEIFLKDVSTGAHNDFERASKIARAMVCEFGMSSKLGPRQYEHRQQEVFLGRDISKESTFSQDTAYEIDKEINKILDECYKNATKIIKRRKKDLELLANTLLEVETLDGEEIKYLLKNKKMLKRKSAASYSAEEIKLIEKYQKEKSEMEKEIFKLNIEYNQVKYQDKTENGQKKLQTIETKRMELHKKLDAHNKKNPLEKKVKKTTKAK